jgi:hypothetical protein
VENCRGYHDAPIAQVFFRAKIGRIQEFIRTALSNGAVLFFHLISSDGLTTPDHYVNSKKLSSIQRQTLKEIFKKIERIQTRLRLEFMGTGVT